MTHAREKLTLQLICGFNFAVADLELTVRRRQFLCVCPVERSDLFFGLDPLSDVSYDGADSEPFRRFVRTETDFDREPTAVFPLPLQLEAATHRSSEWMRTIVRAMM